MTINTTSINATVSGYILHRVEHYTGMHTASHFNPLRKGYNVLAIQYTDAVAFEIGCVVAERLTVARYTDKQTRLLKAVDAYIERIRRNSSQRPFGDAVMNDWSSLNDTYDQYTLYRGLCADFQLTNDEDDSYGKHEQPCIEMLDITEQAFVRNLERIPTAEEQGYTPENERPLTDPQKNLLMTRMNYCGFSEEAKTIFSAFVEQHFGSRSVQPVLDALQQIIDENGHISNGQVEVLRDMYKEGCSEVHQFLLEHKDEIHAMTYKRAYAVIGYLKKLEEKATEGLISKAQIDNLVALSAEAYGVTKDMPCRTCFKMVRQEDYDEICRMYKTFIRINKRHANDKMEDLFNNGLLTELANRVSEIELKKTKPCYAGNLGENGVEVRIQDDGTERPVGNDSTATK